jgi:hypothetical protein
MNSKCVEVSKAPRTELDNNDDDDDDDDGNTAEVEASFLPMILCLITTTAAPSPSDDDVPWKSLEAWSALLLRLSRLLDRPGNH